MHLAYSGYRRVTPVLEERVNIGDVDIIILLGCVVEDAVASPDGSPATLGGLEGEPNPGCKVELGSAVWSSRSAVVFQVITDAELF